MERFGYPDLFLASPDELINAQYADRVHLRPILDAIIATATGFGEIIIQVRKGYVSLRTPRRTFARVQASTKNRIDLALRLNTRRPSRLQPSKIHETTNLQVSLTSLEEIDAEVIDWLRDAYVQNS